MTAYKSSVKKAGDCKQLLSIEIPGQEVENRFQEVFREIQKYAKVPGFRQGKVPMKMVENVYAEKAKDEVIQSLVERAYRASVTKHQVKFLGAPQIKNIHAKRGDKLKFVAEVETRPEFKIKNYKGIQLRRKAIQLKDDEIEKSLDSLRASRAELMPLLAERPAKAGDIVKCDIDITANGKTETRKGLLIEIPLGEHSDDVARQMAGANVGDIREVSPKNQPEQKFRVKILEIKMKKLPELNDEFAVSFGKKDLNELKQEIRDSLMKHRLEESDAKLKDEICRRLLKDNRISVPGKAHEDQKKHLVEDMKRRGGHLAGPEEKNGKLEEEASKIAKDQIALYFLIQRIAETENIQVTPEELQRQLKLLARQTGKKLEEVQESFGHDLLQRLKHDKTIKFILDQATIKEEAS